MGPIRPIKLVRRIYHTVRVSCTKSRYVMLSRVTSSFRHCCCHVNGPLTLWCTSLSCFGAGQDRHFWPQTFSAVDSPANSFHQPLVNALALHSPFRRCWLVHVASPNTKLPATVMSTTRLHSMALLEFQNATDSTLKLNCEPGALSCFTGTCDQAS